MDSGALTIAETVDEIRLALTDYIEATYHVGHPAVVKQRRKLLEAEGVIHRRPYLESTPRYQQGLHFRDLGLPEHARAILELMSQPQSPGESPLLYDPPYSHQATALREAVVNGKSLVITTGTGSGKTESFLMPLLSALAEEAGTSPGTFVLPGVRALLMYPMNALVNDQLGRLRLLLGAPAVAAKFTELGGRPARFARYTSRTLYPGVRTRKKDSERLRPIKEFYVRLLLESKSTDPSRSESASKLIKSLRQRGKWPAKADLTKWFGEAGTHWQAADGSFQRAILMDEDVELFTRHEVLTSAPDVLVTNYSMLEYMMMRPLERPVFEQTASWLESRAENRLLLVVDEAHLYRGAAGAEVGLLLRRFRERLGVGPERFQVICTSASFHDESYARQFAAELTGKEPDDFLTLTGDLALRSPEGKGTPDDADGLAQLDLASFYESTSDDERLAVVQSFLERRGVAPDPEGTTATALHAALEDFPPLNRLVNLTMQEALPLDELGDEIFEVDEPGLAARAVTALVALASTARPSPLEAGLLPCRVHAFFRGLAGLWACVDPECPDREEHHAGSPIGRLYAQPRDTCTCGARVFQYYTCRHCGTSYVRAYTDDVREPSYLWHESGTNFEAAGGRVHVLEPLDLLLEEPTETSVEPADLDLITGRLNPNELGERTRAVYLTPSRDPGQEQAGDGESDLPTEPPGAFTPCGVCRGSMAFGRSSVQDHQTKGDQPFQALVTRQIEVQPPSAKQESAFAPLRGRKVLTFSDSRQTAARLAPNLQTYSMRDVLRPLMMRGWSRLQDSRLPGLNLEDLYLAVMVGAADLSVRLTPKLKPAESFSVMGEISDLALSENLDDPEELDHVRRMALSSHPPDSLLREVVSSLTDRFWGLESLALASIEPAARVARRIDDLPAIPGVAETRDEKHRFAQYWIRSWTLVNGGIWFSSMSHDWWRSKGGVLGHKSGRFESVRRWLDDSARWKTFRDDWAPELLGLFCEDAGGIYRLHAQNLTLHVPGIWGYCQICRTTQRPHPRSQTCISCGRAEVAIVDPDVDNVFNARKGYYRSSSVRALREPHEAPMALVAAEHTAQLNAARSDEVFSTAEKHELRFQDVDVEVDGTTRSRAIDILSCTTTMEVGIDIGTLSGVALRNMPPSRASYQQRSGRAGRRGNAVATVIAFGSSDTHDEHYFTNPYDMICGKVTDPTLALDNADIAGRHTTAYLLQRYHGARLPAIKPDQQPQLFEVLGTVVDFLDAESVLNFEDFERWLTDRADVLKEDVDQWLPKELADPGRQELLDNLSSRSISALRGALPELQATAGNHDPAETDPGGSARPSDEKTEANGDPASEAPPEEGEEHSVDRRRSLENLLDRLLYEGVLPRYAFPTDVVSFHVFDGSSTRFRHEFQYAPSQGLDVALSQYAPGKDVWVDGQLWRSESLYSPYRDERPLAWANRQLYFECRVCGYASTAPYDEAERGTKTDCPACGGADTFGESRNWLRPPGFAHPVWREPGTSPDDQPAVSYATRAKLVAPGPAAEEWTQLTPRVRHAFVRQPLLVTNSGPKGEGYSYCTSCGLIEPAAIVHGVVDGPHQKPYPDEREPGCPGTYTTRGLVLGTDFISDVLLVAINVEHPLTLRPDLLATRVALRTVADALTMAATRRMEIEPRELQAEFRPALTPAGPAGLEAEIYIYDTLPGGAGFSKRAGEFGMSLLEGALDVLEECPDDCDRSCYRCLRSFKNRFEHDLLDRHLGASLLRYVLDGTEPTLSKDRAEAAADLLYADLSRSVAGQNHIEFSRNATVDVPGVGALEVPILARTSSGTRIIGIHGPLTPDHPVDLKLRDVKEFSPAVPVHSVDEIVISRSLPSATKSVIDSLA